MQKLHVSPSRPAPVRRNAASTPTGRKRPPARAGGPARGPAGSGGDRRGGARRSGLFESLFEIGDDVVRVLYTHR